MDPTSLKIAMEWAEKIEEKDAVKAKFMRQNGPTVQITNIPLTQNFLDLPKTLLTHKTNLTHHPHAL